MPLRIPMAAAAASLAAGSLMYVGAPPAAASPTAPSSAAIECGGASGGATTVHRSAVRYGPSSGSSIAFYLSGGETVGFDAYCDNSAGNRWFCIGLCDIGEDGIAGRWIWEGNLR